MLRIKKVVNFERMKLISLQEWNPQIAMNEIDFTKVQFWIQLQGLPLEYLSVSYTEKNLPTVGGGYGG